MSCRLRFSVTACALLFLATHSTAAEPDESLDIYVVRGDSAQLENFHSEIAKDWTGGKFLERLSSKTEYRYWAYPTRTAPEARKFMFGSINYGMQLDFEAYQFEAYQEATYYPAERTALNTIASRCGLRSDSLFIQPDRALVVKSQGADDGSLECITLEMKKVGADMPIKPRSNSVSERG